MSLASPVNHDANKSGGSAYGSGQSDGGRSPLSMSLGFLKSLTEKKSTRVDGTEPKRRGPKPDSKPALTRRQELNRQAQRTHRERKELYIKALEQEILRLKENFSTVTRDRDNIAEENRQLKLLLAQHGIPWTGKGGVDELTATHSAYSSGSISGSYGPGSSSYSPPPLTGSKPSYLGVSPPIDGRLMSQNQNQNQVQPVVDYDQAGIDFVLTYDNPTKALERPCMDHLLLLVEYSAHEQGPPCGHALMASCPPRLHVEDFPEIPFGHGPNHNGQVQKTWDISKGDLANLLDLSKRLNLDGEITPVMAWGMILGHPRFWEMHSEDFKSVAQELGAKMRCYGFGAVLEEFELRDAIEAVLDTKMELLDF